MTMEQARRGFSVYTVEYACRIKVSLLVNHGILAVELCGGMFNLSYDHLYLLFCTSLAFTDI